MEGPATISRRPRILIVDPAELVRRGIRTVLEQAGEIVGERPQASELAQACRELSLDIVVATLPHGALEESAALLRQALRLHPGTRAIVLVEGAAGEDVLVAIRAGASAVLLRETSASTLLEALRDLRAGCTTLDPPLAPCLFEQLAGDPIEAPGRGEPGLDPSVLGLLSAREREVLRLLAQGRHNKEIGAELGVTVGTVKTHLRHIFRKVGVADRTTAVLYALRGRMPRAA